MFYAENLGKYIFTQTEYNLFKWEYSWIIQKIAKFVHVNHNLTFCSVTLCKKKNSDELLIFFTCCNINMFRFQIRPKSFRPIVILNVTRLNFSTLTGNGAYQNQSLKHRSQLLLQRKQPDVTSLMVVPNRSYGILAVRYVIHHNSA